MQGNLPFSTASIFIADSVFEKNGALSGGALWISSGFNLVVAQTEFLNNTADFFGGASFGGAADIGPEGVASFKGCNFTGGWGFHGGGGERAFLCIFEVFVVGGVLFLEHSFFERKGSSFDFFCQDILLRFWITRR